MSRKKKAKNWQDVYLTTNEFYQTRWRKSGRVKYSKEFIDALRKHLDIVDVLMSEMSYGRWKKIGVDFYHICPFHPEKHASFSVVPSKQFYRCFGCGASGDVIQFIMEFHHDSFLEAVDYLVQKYHFEKHWRRYQRNKRKSN